MEEGYAPATGQQPGTLLQVIRSTCEHINVSRSDAYGGSAWCARCWRPRVDPDDQDALDEARGAGLVVCCCDHDDEGGSD